VKKNRTPRYTTVFLFCHMMHIPVLLEPILSQFREKTLKVFVDATLGACGHSLAICREHPELELLVGFDQDKTAIEGAERTPFPCKTLLFHSNFRHLREKLEEHGVPSPDGILIDLGVSSMQLGREERGFSFQQEGPLDMRMDRRGSLTAEDIVNSWTEKELADLFFELGEERFSRRIAKALVQARKKERIDTTLKLASLVASCAPMPKGIHPATRVFQALRLAVNEELDSLKEVIPQAVSLLAPGGLLAIISFHSLEDRIVKYAFRESPGCEVLTKKPIIPTEEECRQNRRSRSAKLRILRKIEDKK
jgi:16S rRNA (cytosine1402-N4)-methyltransferase